MPEDRHRHLIKCAEEVIGLMNIGVKPDLALRKVADDEALNSHEVTLVSHAVNNSKTLSHLANSKADEKGKPFPITNAELVNQNLIDGDPVSDAEEGADEKAAKKNEKTDAMAKKEAAAQTMVDDGFYLDATPEDHRAIARQAFGVAEPLKQRKQASVAVHDDLTVHFTNGLNAWQKLAALKRAYEDASIEYTRARDAAEDQIDRLATDFRQTGAPAFAEVEKIARYQGCSDETLDLIYTAGGLDTIGHKRAPANEKLAGVVTAPAKILNMSNEALRSESLWKRAADCFALREHLKAGYAEMDAHLCKAAGDNGLSIDADADIARLSDNVRSMPEHILPKDDSHDLLSQTITDVGGAYGDPESFKVPAANPLPISSRQDMANIDGRKSIEGLLGDDFIKNHPIQDVVGAYNRARSVNPNLSQAELMSMVRQDLATEGGVPIDLMLRARKGPGGAGAGAQ